MTLFGSLATVGGIHSLVAQPPAPRMYSIFLLLMAAACVLGGLPTLFGRTRFFFDRTARSLTLEHKGLLRTKRETQSLDSLTAVVLVRYWLFNRLARAESSHWYRLQLHGPTGLLLELASKLPEAAASDAAGAIASHLQLPVEQHEGRVEGVVSGR